MSGRDTDDRGGSGEGSGDDEGSSTVERAVTVVSVVVTVFVFGFVLWQGLALPQAGPPEARVLDASPMDNGSVEAVVAVANPTAGGLDSVTVAVACRTPPVEVAFEHVPVGGRRTASVVCPAGSRRINASVASWIEA